MHVKGYNERPSRTRGCLGAPTPYSPLPVPDNLSSHVRARTCAGFTLIEVLVVIAIIGMLAALLLPTMREAKQAGRRVACLANVRQCLIANRVYSADFGDFVYNWQIGVPHTEHMSNNYGMVYTKDATLYSWQKCSDGTYNQHDHMLPEGDGVYPFWEYYILTLKYIDNPDAMGCAVSCPGNWTVWPGSYTVTTGVAITDDKQIRRAPPFVYRGPSSSDDERNTIYTSGQIAGNGASDPAFGGRSGSWYPHVKRGGRAKPMFMCPVFEKGVIDCTEFYASPHALPRGVRNRSILPMMGGWGRYNHYLEESVGWSDGHAIFAMQPRDDPGGWFVDYNGKVVPYDASGF